MLPASSLWRKTSANALLVTPLNLSYVKDFDQKNPYIFSLHGHVQRAEAGSSAPHTVINVQKQNESVERFYNIISYISHNNLRSMV